MSENQIQKTILDYLGYQKNIYFFRSSSGALRLENGAFLRTGKKGCPDIIVCKNGKFIGLEVKTDKGKQSDSQKQAEQEIIKSGGIYKIVKSLDDVIKLL
jgi:hypothetical protein